MSMEDLINSMFTNGEGVNRGEEIRAHREMFRGSEFVCGCGGNVYPFSPDMGLCSSCKEEQNLSELDYESDGDRDCDCDDFPDAVEDFTAEDDAIEEAERRREAERLEDEHREALAFDFDDDRMDIDIPQQIPGVTLNGGPVFEEDFE